MSKLEAKAYAILKDNKMDVFRITDICLLLSLTKINAYNLIKSLKEKKIIKKSGTSLFAFADTNEFVIGVNNNVPSYISFWTALTYYGWSDQLSKKIYLCAVKYCRERSNFHYVVVAKKRFFGYASCGEITIAEKEKAIIDSLYRPKYAGGIKEIQKSIDHALKEIDQEKLIKYAMRIKSKAVLRRLGFILEHKKFKKSLLNKIRKNIGKGYEVLDPALPKKNNYNDKWLLDVNI